MSEILIVGGGIGGLTTAIALQKRGIGAHVFERTSGPEAAGAGIWVPPNAMQVLDGLGLAESVYREGKPVDRVEICDRNGSLLQSIDLEETRGETGHTLVSIHRARLHKILAEALEPGTLHFGRPLAGFRESLRSITALFESGDEREGALIVGADGIHSTVRRILFPSIAPQYAGQTCYRGITNLRLSDELSRLARETWGGTSRVGFSAISDDEVYWFAPITAPPDEPDPANIRSYLTDLYADFPPPIPKIVRTTLLEKITRTDLEDLPPLPSWSSGRVVLLGDAAHAMTPNLGQGGAQAIEDAAALADAIARHGTDDCRTALSAYESSRKEYVERLARDSRRFGALAHLGPRLLQIVRNTAIRLAPGSWQQRRIAMMGGKQ
jgi:2-polyprenyl-6-methoxyphenol hydroxylase-like FAD-dependent oxidoreductase